jgi:hypothetical protein
MWEFVWSGGVVAAAGDPAGTVYGYAGLAIAFFVVLWVICWVVQCVIRDGVAAGIRKANRANDDLRAPSRKPLDPAAQRALAAMENRQPVRW